MRYLALLPLVTLACGTFVQVDSGTSAASGVTTAGANDAGTPPVVTPLADAGAVVAATARKCQTSQLFGSMTKVALPVTQTVESFAMSPSGIGFVSFGARTSPGAGAIRQFIATGDTIGPLTSLGPSFESDRSLSQAILGPDGRTMFLTRLSSTSKAEMLFAQRDPGGNFGAPQAVSHPGVNDALFGPYPAGTNVYFSRVSGTTPEHLAVASFDASSGILGTPHDLNLMGNATWNAVVTPDELEIFYASSPSAGAATVSHASRSTTSEAFGFDVPPTSVPDDSESFDYPTWISPDACTLFVVSFHESTPADVWRATRM